MGKAFEALTKAEKEQGINYLSTTKENLLQGYDKPKPKRRQSGLEIFKGEVAVHGYSKSGLRSSMVDYYKVLRSQIKRRIDAEKIQSMLITSAIEGEGKSFTAINLALAFAMLPDQKVFLIEANLRKPFLETLLGFPTERLGLVDYLQDDIPIEELMIDPGIPNLKILPAGGVISDSAELLAHNRMGDMISNLIGANKDCLILFDGSSLYKYPDTLILMEAVQSVLLVLKAESTPIEKVRDAYEKLEGQNLVGVVLNMVKQDV